MTPRGVIVAVVCASIAVTATPALAAQALSGRELQRVLKEATDAMESARALLSRGNKRRAASRLKEAEETYRGILETNADQRDAAVGLAEIFFLTRRYGDGVTLMRPFYERLPDDHDVAHQYGLHLYRSGEHDIAVPILETVAEDPERFDASWLLAVYFYRQAAWVKGIAHAKRYVAARPEDTRALALLGTYHLKNSQFAEAIGALDAYLAEHPDNTAARINRANAHFRLGHYNEAAQAYEAMVEEFPERTRLVYNLASVRIKQDRCEDAVSLLDRYLSRADKTGTALYFKADCLFKLGRYAEARDAFQSAGAESAHNPWIYHGLSRIALSERKYDEAIGHAEKAVELAGQDWEIVGWLGTVLRRAGRPGDAIAWHGKAIELKPEAAVMHVELGRDLWAMHRAADALSAFEAAYGLDKEVPGAVAGLVASHTALGITAYQEGDTPTAQARLQSALSYDDRSVAARTNLALVALSKGELDVAEEAMAPLSDVDASGDYHAVMALIHLRRDRLDEAQRSLDRAKRAKSQVHRLVTIVGAHLAARRGDWLRAAEAFELAAKDHTDEVLDAARAHAWLALGLERLAGGEGAQARTALARANRLKHKLTAKDQATLEFAHAATATAAGPRPEARARELARLMASKRYRGAQWADLRDLSQTYVALGYLRAGLATKALGLLDRIQRPQNAATAIARMRGYAEDLLAQRSFAAGKFADAETRWTALVKLDAGDLAAAHNAAVAQFQQGKLEVAAAAWRKIQATGPAETHFNLANVADRHGDQKEAYDLYRRYLRTGKLHKADANARADAKAKLFGFGAGGGS